MQPGFRRRVDGCHEIERSDWSDLPRVSMSLVGAAY